MSDKYSFIQFSDIILIVIAIPYVNDIRSSAVP